MKWSSVPTNREWASIILVGAFIVFGLMVPKARAHVPSLIRTALHWKFVVGFGALLVWVGLLVDLAASLRLWNLGLLTDTLFITFGIGFPLAGRATQAKSGPDIVRLAVVASLSFGALLLFYLNLEPFALWGELIFQPLVVLFVLLAYTARRDAKTVRVGNFFNGLVVIAVIFAVVWTGVQLALNFSTLDWREVLLDLALSVWLPVLLIPFIFVLAYVSYCDYIFGFALGFKRDTPLKFRPRVGYFLGLHFRIALASKFGPRYKNLGDAETFRAALSRMREFREDVARREQDEKDRLRSLTDNAGALGTDESGAQLDRREFDATKNALEWISTTQLTRYRANGNRYWDSLLGTLIDVRRWFPDDEDIHVEMTRDAQRWRAWRRLPSGWYLTIGGEAGNVWSYYGSANVPPATWPGTGPGWTPESSEVLPPDWEVDDGSRL
jgi:hypothetical protein